MNAINATKKLNERELELVVQPEASWHRDYDDTAFIYIGGLPLDLSEGDVITIFSQFGEPVFINMVRDKETGKSKGFCFLKYEDQRSCTLAVDNLGGATIMGRMLRVDHTRYKKRDDEEIFDNTMGNQKNGTSATDTEGASDEEIPDRPMLKEEKELARLLQDEEDDDPMKAYMIEQKREEVAIARAKLDKRERKEKKHRNSHKSRRHDYDRRDNRRRDSSEEADRRDRRRRHGDEGESRQRRRRRHDESDEDRRETRKRHDDSDEKRRQRQRSRSPRAKGEKVQSRRERELSKTPVYGD